MSVIISLYCICAVLLTVYGINCHVLTRVFRTRYLARQENDRRFISEYYGGRSPADGMAHVAGRLPVVTTQLPIFNERNVAERLIDAVAAFRYPAGKHEIQVLDDSTDETRDMVARKVADLRSRGVDIRHITRRVRTGFKAGALREGLAQARGEFTAIFDADFVPPPDFLLRAIPHFLAKPELGFVQGRWGHLNRGESLVTRLQSIGINGHFMIEQSARNSAGWFLNFNGTAGIFRNRAILDAGNWQDDTLTEDMDLSYRIQLAGWHGHYLVDLVAPAEIPCNINDFKSQQFRWAKGSTQTAIKLLPRIMASGASPIAKIQAILHLTHYAVHPLMLYLALMAGPVLLSGELRLAPIVFFCFGWVLLASCSGPSRMYFAAERSLSSNLLKTLMLLPAMIGFGCGLAINNSRAVFEAVIGRKSGFIRTPKKGGGRRLYAAAKSRLFFLELLVGLWCLAGTVIYFSARHYLVGHFLFAYAAGFLCIGSLSWLHGRRS